MSSHSERGESMTTCEQLVDLHMHCLELASQSTHLVDALSRASAASITTTTSRTRQNIRECILDSVEFFAQLGVSMVKLNENINELIKSVMYSTHNVLFYILQFAKTIQMHA